MLLHIYQLRLTRRNLRRTLTRKGLADLDTSEVNEAMIRPYHLGHHSQHTTPKPSSFWATSIITTEHPPSSSTNFTYCHKQEVQPLPRWRVCMPLLSYDFACAQAARILFKKCHWHKYGETDFSTIARESLSKPPAFTTSIEAPSGSMSWDMSRTVYPILLQHLRWGSNKVSRSIRM